MSNLAHWSDRDNDLVIDFTRIAEHAWRLLATR